MAEAKAVLGEVRSSAWWFMLPALVIWMAVYEFFIVGLSDLFEAIFVAAGVATLLIFCTVIAVRHERRRSAAADQLRHDLANALLALEMTSALWPIDAASGTEASSLIAPALTTELRKLRRQLGVLEALGRHPASQRVAAPSLAKSA